MELHNRDFLYCQKLAFLWFLCKVLLISPGFNLSNLGGCSKFALIKYLFLISKSNLGTAYGEILPSDAAESI